MIILTQPGIQAFNPTRMSSVINYFQDFCLAEVSDDFSPTEKEMIDNNIDFWWSVQGSQVDASEYEIQKYKEGIIYGIEDQLGLTKEINRAYAIHAIAYESGKDVWTVWDESIL